MGKNAVVLGGGGAKGSYEIGVMKALRKLRFRYQIVTGTSVGSLNGALYAQKNCRLAEKMWLQIDTAGVLDVADSGAVGYRELAALLVENRGLSYTNLEKLIRKVVDEKKVRTSGVEFGLVTVHFPSMQPVQLFADEMEEGKLHDYLLASAACFPAMKKHEIDGKKYIDGGYFDNVPIDLAIARGAETIVAVDLDSIGIARKAKDRPNVTIITVKSDWPLGPMLLFDQKQAALNIKQGYVDTMKAFGKWEGRKFCFYPGTCEKIFCRAYPALERYRETILSDGANPLMRIAQNAVGKMYQRRLRKESGLTKREMSFAVCEGLMELFELDRFSLYSERKLKRELSAVYREIDASPAHALEELLKEIRKSKKFVERMEEVTALATGIDRKVLVKYLIDLMEEGKTEQSIWNLLHLCLPLEFYSALFYLALCSHDHR